MRTNKNHKCQDNARLVAGDAVEQEPLGARGAVGYVPEDAVEQGAGEEPLGAQDAVEQGGEEQPKVP